MKCYCVFHLRDFLETSFRKFGTTKTLENRTVAVKRVFKKINQLKGRSRIPQLFLGNTEQTFQQATQ